MEFITSMKVEIKFAFLAEMFLSGTNNILKRLHWLI